MPKLLNVSLQEFLTYNRRARKASLRAFLRKWKKDHADLPEKPLGLHQTRDEVLYDARQIIENLRWKRLHDAQSRVRKSDRDKRLEHRERQIKLNEAAKYRKTALLCKRVKPEGKAFYVSILSGKQLGYLYGPLPTQMAALRAKPFIRNIAHDVNGTDAAFAAFGTISISIEDARPGILNAYVPHETAAYLQKIGCQIFNTYDTSEDAVNITYQTVSTTDNQLVLI